MQFGEFCRLLFVATDAIHLLFLRGYFTCGEPFGFAQESLVEPMRNPVDSGVTGNAMFVGVDAVVQNIRLHVQGTFAALAKFSRGRGEAFHAMAFQACAIGRFGINRLCFISAFPWERL